MSYDDWPDDSMETRREMVRKTIRPATWEEIKTLGDQRFTVATDPWAIRFDEFMRSHKAAKFYRAEAPGGAEVVYCRESESGIWFLPGSGMGIIQPKGLQALKEIVDAL